ncbi:MAG TPA: PP2C family protein-serine/threonine phosphatase [Roseiflexaceae bacterium]|nr:PP2C family protein-serine/threonine phosphatase [Roseiflexaceae bacterium]
MSASPRQLKRQRIRTTLLGHIGVPRRTRRVRSSPVVVDEGQRRQAELEQDLLMARDIQQGLLLEAVPRLPGWEISAMSLPARDLGGDLYDFLPLADGWHGIMIGDVSGKGLPAALRMAVTRTVFRHEARRGADPAVTLAAVNNGVLSEIPQGMVTMVYVMLNTGNGCLRIANAGHNYPIVLNGHIHEVELTGLPLGVIGGSEYDELSGGLRHGDTVLLYTDGVIEATNPRGEIFGYDRLVAVLHANNILKPRALLSVLLHELRAWSDGEQTDDITMVIVRRRHERLADELRSAAEDVLGGERATQLWSAVVLPDGDQVEAWAAALPELMRVVQTLYGRGLARELNGQLRLILEEYR